MTGVKASGALKEVAKRSCQADELTAPAERLRLLEFLGSNSPLDFSGPGAQFGPLLRLKINRSQGSRRQMVFFSSEQLKQFYKARIMSHHNYALKTVIDFG